jgi:hypothetical protein
LREVNDCDRSDTSPAALVVPVLASVLRRAGRAAALVHAQAQPASQDEAAPAHAGGEANLVLPDLSVVDFHGINGRTAADERPAGVRARACCSA